VKRVIIGALAISLTLVGISIASAHTVLIFSNPSRGATVRVLPAKITLKFAEPLLTLGKRAINKVVVTNPENFLVSTGTTSTKGAFLTAPLMNITPVTGIYKVSYRVSAQDGHIVTGSFTFKLQN